MPDIIDVSDSILRLVQGTRLFSDSSDISDAVVRLVPVRERNKTRIISQTVTINETIALYKNGELVVPPPPPELPTPQNIIGFRQRALRAPRRPPRAILIEAELTNLVISPLKILAFSDSINKIIVGIRPRLVHNVALSPVSLVPQRQLINSSIKMQSKPMTVKSKLALLSSPEMWARSRLKTRPDIQSIHALKAVNFEKMHKLTRIMKIAMLAQSL